MGKIIRVKSCAGCDVKHRSVGYCYRTREDGSSYSMVILNYIASKTIHPGCPLDDEEVNDATRNNEDETLMQFLEQLSMASHGNKLKVGDESVDKAIEDIVYYVENHASEYADYVMKRKRQGE